MSDELLPYYNRELDYLRRLGADFAQSHPKIAQRLRIGGDGFQDPHVERMVEAFAFLTARIRHKLDDDFPEISDTLLNLLYPHYLAPIPSMAIARISLDRAQADLVAGYTVERHSQVETPGPDGNCTFRTCQPVTIWPIEVVAASLGPIAHGRPGEAAQKAVAVLRLELKCFAKDMTFGKMKIPALRFFLRGQANVMALYELVHNNALEVTVGNPAKATVASLSGKAPGPAAAGASGAPALIGKSSIRMVGFERDEGILPYTAQSFPGYRLWTEYFLFPQKHLFVEIAIPPQALAPVGNSLEIAVYLNKTHPDLERTTGPQSFELGCTPIVNLFPHKAEPIELTQMQSECHVCPDSRRPTAFEIHTIERVTATGPEGQKAEYQPFYSVKHSADAHPARPFWFATRKPARASGVDGGTEMFLSLADLQMDPSAPAHWVLEVETTCLNRDMPARLPFGGGQPRMQLSSGGPVAVECLTQPTETRRPPRRHGAVWRLISHLSLNHLSVTGDESGGLALREILKLYDFADSADSRSRIESIQSVSSRRTVGRAGGATAGGFCRGVEVNIKLDEERFSDGGAFLFASVLERFLGLYCSINSFSQMVATTAQRGEELRRWKPRAGDMILS